MDKSAPKINSNRDKRAGKGASLVDVLVEDGVLTQEQAEKVRLELIKTGEEEKAVLRRLRLVDESSLNQAWAKVLKVPFVDLDKEGFSPQALTFVPRSVAERYTLLPYSFEARDKTLGLAMANPLDLETVEFLEKKTGLKIKVALALEKQIKDGIKVRYEQELTSQVTEALKDTEKKTQVVVGKDIGRSIKEAPIAKIVMTILEFAMKSRASDVHIEPQERSTRVRYRIDGIMVEKLLLPKNVHDAVVSRIKILSDMKIDEKRVPQDGRFSFSADGESVDLRVSTAPSIHGEKVVMRLLKKGQEAVELVDLGLRGRALRNLREAVDRPHGIVLVCGPTGSGKTTTLYSLLSKLSTTRVNVITVEDPVEYEILGVTQVQVNVQAGLTFASALRSFLRQDPDIIMVGEIRDQETADLAINASLTGHLVFSTLHTNDAAGAPPRLIDMGAEPFLLVSSLTCVAAQRVLRKVCSHCSQEIEIAPEILTDMKEVLGPIYGMVSQKWEKEGKQMKIKKPVGCEKCGETGYMGRVGIFEVMPVSEKISQAIVSKSAASELQKLAIEEGMMTMKQDGYVKVLEGVTTIEEVLRVAQY